MISSIELQVISKILTTDNPIELDELLKFDRSYYSVFQKHIDFILAHNDKYNSVPDVFTFQAEFPDVELVSVSEPIEFLCSEMRKNKQRIMLISVFNKLKDLDSGDVSEAWQYLSDQAEKALSLEAGQPMDIIHDAKKRSEIVVEFGKQARIPTGFPEIDKLMYGGLSTVEELLLIIARTNTGKSWVCTKMMESAQKNGFPVIYYSPEMQAAFLGTRFDTWRSHFKNSQLYQGNYTAEYYEYIKQLSQETTSAYVLEDKDMPEGVVNTQSLAALVKRYSAKLLIIDGLSYMEDTKKSDTDYVRYKNMCTELFRMSKRYGCAVVVVMQANRETQNLKDDKGEPFPSLYQIEGSDHPARIATQAFSLRQVFDKHVLDIRLEKSRNANNTKPILSYAWDPNTGNMQYLPDDGNEVDSPAAQPHIAAPQITTHATAPDINLDEDDYDEPEF